MSWMGYYLNITMHTYTDIYSKVSALYIPFKDVTKSEHA